MRSIFLILLLSASTLFAQKTPFASQSDMVVDLSDAILDDIYRHRLGFERCPFEKSIWAEGFGSYRKRDGSSERRRYDNWWGGLLGGLNYGISCDHYLNFFVGGSWGGIDIRGEEPNFDTYSVLFGATWERFCYNRFFGLAIVGGVLDQDRTFRGNFGALKENPHGVFISPEFTYAYQFNGRCFCPIFSGTLRYAGFFSRDYQNRRTLGTLYIKERAIQFFTLRGEYALPFDFSCLNLQPYIGGAGRFQFDGNRITGRLILDNKCFSDGINSSIGYGLLGIRALKQCGCFDLQANMEGSYDSDCSWRALGELTLNYAF